MTPAGSAACRSDPASWKAPAIASSGVGSKERGHHWSKAGAKAERSPQARRKIAAKRTRSGKVVHDFLRLLAQLGTLTMNRIEPSGPEKPGFDGPASPTPIQAQALRLLNANIPMR